MSSVVENIGIDVNIDAACSDLAGSRVFGPRVEQFRNQTFVRLFEAQVREHPSRTAVVSHHGDLNYSELNARANQVARMLRKNGARPESIVGICIDRSVDMAIGIVGILKAGAAYLPLDPDYPKERLAWLLNDSAVSTIVTKSTVAAAVSDVDARLVSLDSAELNEQAKDNLDARPQPDDLAYVIYTSGSTGQPKGVEIDHSNLANYLLALQHEIHLTPSDRYLHTASISFSSSRRQLLLPLSQGASVVIANSEERKDPLALFEMIKNDNVSVMDAVPSFWRTCTDLLLSIDAVTRARLLHNRLRLMLSASEPLLSDIPDTWRRQFNHPAQHIHMFGQTETAGIVCTYRVPEVCNGDAAMVPIGKPIANTDIYILDEDKQLLPLGTPGELYIGGAGVGRGYLKRPDISAHKFITHSFDGEPPVRLYRTGDFARMTHAGVIEFAGRQDSQVKLRGFRIELGEIEATLARHPGVKQSAVVIRDNASEAKKLIAYFVGRETSPATFELKSFLAERLPDYMVPAAFVELNALPLTANGKIDKRALLDPAKVRTANAAYIAPSTATEKRVASIWESVLGVQLIGIRDNFFDLGGHSLLAIQVIARINSEFKRIVPLRTLFDHPTIAELSAALDRSAAGGQPCQPIERADRNRPLALSFPQQRLWFIDQLEPGSSLYNIRKAFRLRGEVDAAKLKKAVQQLTARHEILRTTFVANEGLPVQVIHRSIEVPFRVEDLRSLPLATRPVEVQRLLQAESEKPFDLARGPLLRMLLVRSDEQEYVLLLCIHHIISDAWTIKLFFQELSSLYQSQDAKLPPLRIQYADFAGWQRNIADSNAPALDYWKQYLADAPLSLSLPSDFRIPAAPTYRGAQQSLVLPAELYEALRDTCREQGVTLFMFLLAAFQVLLSLYSGLDDILVGTPVAGRELIETEGLLGCFINTLIMRGKFSGSPTWREVLQRARSNALDAYTHQSVPFEKLVEELRPERSLTRNPLFQTMFVLQDETESELSLPDIETEAVQFDSAATKFDLTLTAVEKKDALELRLSYSTDLYADESVNAMLSDFEHILESLSANLDQKVSQLPRLRWTPKIKASLNAVSSRNEKAVFTVPRTPIEEKLADIWKEVLRVPKVGVFDNFFDLGGHSLLAAQVISRARTTLGIELPLRQLFETPHIAGVAEAVYQLQTADTEDEELAAMLAELSQLSEEEARQRFAESSK